MEPQEWSNPDPTHSGLKGPKEKVAESSAKKKKKSRKVVFSCRSALLERKPTLMRVWGLWGRVGPEPQVAMPREIPTRNRIGETVAKTQETQVRDHPLGLAELCSQLGPSLLGRKHLQSPPSWPSNLSTAGEGPAPDQGTPLPYPRNLFCDEKNALTGRHEPRERQVR